MKKNKIIYAGLAADILHEGHINILNQHQSRQSNRRFIN